MVKGVGHVYKIDKQNRQLLTNNSVPVETETKTEENEIINKEIIESDQELITK